MQFVGAVEFIKTMEWAQQWLIHEWWIYQNNLIKNLVEFKIWWENKWSKWWFFGLCYKSWYKVRSDYNQHHMSWTERKNQHIRHKLESEQDDGQKCQLLPLSGIFNAYILVIIWAHLLSMWLWLWSTVYDLIERKYDNLPTFACLLLDSIKMIPRV